MYDERIENLIKAALADGELTEKEKQILFKNAEAQGIDLDEFEMILDARLVELKKLEAAQTKKQELEMEKAKAAVLAAPDAPKSNKMGDIKKCPACGIIVGGYQAMCPECGHEFSNIEANLSVMKFFDMLKEIDGMAKSENIKVRIDGKEYIKQVDNKKELTDKKITIISNFPIPSTKADLMEFLSILSTKCAFGAVNRSDFEKACYSKYKECLIKADVLFPDDKMFTKFETMLSNGDKKRKKKIIWIVVGVIVFYAVVFGLAFLSEL